MSRIFTAIEWLLITITKSPMRMQAGAHSPFVTKAIDHCLALTELAAFAGHFKRPVIRDDRFVMSRSCDCMSVGTTLVLLI
jgi:hypothetical protein